ncbi:sugar kinase [Gilvimarinus agarilyticus]|nr:sugar kinase [Gilvimarinus agarilyticus]
MSKKRVITFGELLMRLDVPNQARFEQANGFKASYGGTEANVAVNLTKMGMPSKFVTVLPDNDLGRAARGHMQKSGVDVSDVLMQGRRLGLYFHETGTMLRSSNVIYDREQSAFAEAKPGDFDWKEILKGYDWLHWSGVTPAVSEQAYNLLLEAIKEARALGMTISVDLNIRKKLWNWGRKPNEVLPELIEECDILLGNEEHIKELFGIEECPYDLRSSTAHLGEVLTSRFTNLKNVVVTWRRTISASHNKISAAIFDEHNVYEGRVIDIPDILDRVGSGDALTSGIIYGLIQFEHDLYKTIDYAIACSAMKHTIPGDLNLATSQEIMAIVDGDNQGVKR